MLRRALTTLIAALVALVGLLADPPTATATAVVAPAVARVVTVTPPTDPVAGEENPFIPADRNLSDCVSAVPKPGCGSEARGGWRQALVFGIVVVGLAIVGWRIVHTVRRNRREVELEHIAGGHRGA